MTSILQITQEFLEALSSAHHDSSAGGADGSSAGGAGAVLEGEFYQLKQILSPFLYLAKDRRPELTERDVMSAVKSQNESRMTGLVLAVDVHSRV